ncbi:CZB domain-containing protein [Acinetobacter baumannii]
MDKKALEEKFEEFARWYVLPLDKSEDGIYRALETQSAWMSFQHQQAKVEELQKRLDGALKETQYALQYVEEDMRGNHEFLQMAMIRTLKALEQVLKGGEA